MGEERCDEREVERVIGECASSCSWGKAEVENGITERLGFGGLGEEGRCDYAGR